MHLASGRRMSWALQQSVAQSVSQDDNNQDATTPSRLRALPPELRQLIGAAAFPRDRISLAKADPREMYPLMKNELRAAFIVTTHAPTVKTLARFKSLLRRIQELPPSLRGESLAVLGPRIPSLPPENQQDAIDTFVANAQNLPEPKPALFDELVEAISKGPIGLVGRLAAREQMLVTGFAGPAVRNGDSVIATAERYGITGPGAILKLEIIAVRGPAGEAVRNGASVIATAERYGITGPGRIRTLENFSVMGPAGEAVRNGDSVTATAELFGITGPRAISRLEAIAARRPAGAA